MAYRMTKEELDQQFEQFLKESVSDDSVELGSSSTHPSVLDQLGKVPQKPFKKSHVPVPWWQDDEDSEEALGKVPSKPTPKPRSKVLNRDNHQDKIHLLYQETSPNTDRQSCSEHTTEKPKKLLSNEYSCSEEKRASEDDALDSNSLSTAEFSHNIPRQTSVIPTDSDNAPSESSASDSSGDNGLLPSGKTFLKSLRKSQPIQEVDEDKSQEHRSGNGSQGDAIFSRDSLEPEESLMVPRSIAAALEMDEEEKARFFGQRMEDRGSESLGDDQNRETSSSNISSTKRERAVSLTLPDQREENTPASPAYSEDFEDEVSEKKTEEKKPERCGMLAKVSLHDSLNDTDGDQVAALMNYVVERTECQNFRITEAAGPDAPVSLYDLNGTDGNQMATVGNDVTERSEQPSMGDAAGPLAPGHSYGHSGGSEMEALQEAYQQISTISQVQESIRSPTSPATPERSTETHRHGSTAGSDLPTAEELMQAIGPESGFTYCLSLQPRSEAVGDDNAERIASEGSPDRAVGLRGVNKENPAVVEPHMATLQNRQWSIANELERLMQEDSPERPSVSNKGKKQQVSGRSTTTRPTFLASRKASVPSERTKKAEARPLAKPSAPSRTKAPVALAQRKSQSQITNKTYVLNQTHTVKGPDSGLRVSSELLTSVQSFAAFLEHQMKEDYLNSDRPDISDNMHQTENRTDLVKEVPSGSGLDLVLKPSSMEQMSLQLAQNKRQLLLREEQLQQEHSKEINVLKQENYLLQSKLHSLEEAWKKQRWKFGKATDPATEEKLAQIEKEMMQQETVIQGYHMENEKLYTQMKALQAQSKQQEEVMFAENQRLLSELAFTKEQFNRINNQKTVGSVVAADKQYSVTELMAQVQTVERTEAKLQEEVQRLKQEKQALQVDLQMMRKERDLAKAQIVYTSGDKVFELKLLEERHKEEVSELKKRLQWYAENQELLDKDAVRLRTASTEIKRLTEQVEKLKTEAAKQSSLQEKKTKERAGDAKRIQDLERQVKEMEEILRRKHPNSLPALIYAAAAAGGQEGGSSNQHAAPKLSQTTALLERRIHRLEAELEGRDEEAKRTLRAMEQQFQKIKLVEAALRAQSDGEEVLEEYQTEALTDATRRQMVNCCHRLAHWGVSVSVNQALLHSCKAAL